MAARLGKSYANVFDLLREEFPEQPGLADGAMAAYRRGKISNSLFMLRTRCGVTQAELARRMGVSQSKIAKLEDKGDSVKFSDVIAFVEALDHSVNLQFAGKARACLRLEFPDGGQRK